MAPYQAILAYDGTDFHGYQRQKEHRTVQVVVETALREIGWEGKAVRGAGRTDAGVHAYGQVIGFTLRWSQSPQKLRNALNARLPADVSVRSVEETTESFHPRYDARWRQYLYRVSADEIRHPIHERYRWRVWPPPEFNLLTKAAACLTGIHDFAAFGRPHEAGGSTIRHIKQAEWTELDGGFQFIVEGNAFLYHMVRRLVFAQLKIGQKKAHVAHLIQALETRDADLFQGIAPPNGLFLAHIEYAAEQMREG